MKNVIIVLMLLAGLALCSSCHKHQDQPLINLDSDTAVDAHFNYKIGSYWIYRDSLNGRIDCFYVASNYFVKVGEETNVYNYHFVSISDHNVDGSNPKDSSLWVLNFQANNLVLDLNYGRNAYGWKTDITYNPLISYPFPIGPIASNFDTVVVAYVDSFFRLDTLKLYNVALVHHNISVSPSQVAPGLTSLYDWFYINDSVGLVKMSVSHPQDTFAHVWELQRYHIVK